MTDVIAENESLRNQVESVGEMTCSIVVKTMICQKVCGFGSEDKNSKIQERNKFKYRFGIFEMRKVGEEVCKYLLDL